MAEIPTVSPIRRRCVDRIRGLAWLVLCIVTGCAGQSDRHEVYQYLDESTGVTVTTLSAPLAFFKDEPMLAANARDYVYIGPAELNRTGKRETVLWVSSQIERLSGISPEVFTAHPETWAEHLHPEDRDRVLASFDRLLILPAG